MMLKTIHFIVAALIACNVWAIDNKPTKQSRQSSNAISTPASESLDMWGYKVLDDRFDGRSEIISSSIKTNQKNSARIVFRMRQNGALDAYLITGDRYICDGDDLFASVIFDNQEPSTWRMSIAKSNDALFLDKPIIFASKLATAKDTLNKSACDEKR
jgi:hypothetical protein